MTASTTHLPATLTFEGVTLDVLHLDGEIWLRGPQIGDALGYSKDGRVAIDKLYKANADEFNDKMTRLVKLPTAGGEQTVRVFSLRGAHLLGMFARTERARAFRRWVLDVLDQYVQQLPADATETLTPSEQQQLQEAVNMRCHGLPPERQGKARAEIWSRIHHRFRIARYQQLPRHQLVEAIAYVLKMDLHGCPPPDAPQARERVSERDMRAIRRVIWQIATCFHHDTAFAQAVWKFLRRELQHPAPNPWYVDQLPGIAALLGRLLAYAMKAREFVQDIESQVIRHILRGPLAEETLLEFAAAERAKIGGMLASEPELPNWLRADLLFVTDRSRALLSDWPLYSEAAH